MPEVSLQKEFLKFSLEVNLQTEIAFKMIFWIYLWFSKLIWGLEILFSLLQNSSGSFVSSQGDGAAAHFTSNALSEKRGNGYEPASLRL